MPGTVLNYRMNHALHKFLWPGTKHPGFHRMKRAETQVQIPCMTPSHGDKASYSRRGSASETALHPTRLLGQILPL